MEACRLRKAMENVDILSCVPLVLIQFLQNNNPEYCCHNTAFDINGVYIVSPVFKCSSSVSVARGYCVVKFLHRMSQGQRVVKPLALHVLMVDGGEESGGSSGGIPYPWQFKWRMLPIALRAKTVEAV
jgi:hypothetical protein